MDKIIKSSFILQRYDTPNFLFVKGVKDKCYCLLIAKVKAPPKRNECRVNFCKKDISIAKVNMAV